MPAFRLPPALSRRGAPPLALLLIALSSVFVFGGDRGQFYRPSIHDSTSMHTLTLAENLSAEHGFVGFFRQRLDRNGEREYVVYNRFPIGSYALVKLAILPFGDDFPRAIRAARLLMLACFAAAAVLAHLALVRLIGHPWIALAATLLAFSSYYLLRYNDTVSAELSTNLLGAMLTFHGMAVFAQEGRFRQLLAKTAVAILLGWHVLALAAPFALLGLGSALLRARGGDDPRPYARRALRVLARSRCLAYGGFAALCGALMLGFNLGAEFRALGGEVPLHELPSFDSILRRTGQAAGADAAHYGADGPAFLRGQLGGIGGVAIPFAAVDRLGLGLAQPYYDLWPPPAAARWFAVPGAAVLAACLAGLRVLPHRTLFAALLLAGWCWAIPFRGQTSLHEFYALAHAGVPLVFFALALLGLRRLLGRERAARALPAIACAAVAVFAISARDMAHAGHAVPDHLLYPPPGRGGYDAEAAARQREWAADFRAMRGAAAGRSILVGAIDPALTYRQSMRNYYLAGSFLQIDPIGSEREWREASRHDFVVLRANLGGSLTPDNRRFFLYRTSALPDRYAAIAAGEPAVRAPFDLRLDGRTLTLARDGCGGDDAAPRFFLHVVPLDAGDLPAGRRAAGFEESGFALDDRGVRFGGRCMARIELPDYPVAGVRAGQRSANLPPVWEASLPVGDPAFPRRAATWRETAAAREPALRAPFDLHLEGRALIFVRDGCSEADTEDRFFVHAVAADAADLPEARRKYGSERLTFAFPERGVRFGGACLAAFELPDYAILGVRAGQYGAAGEVWAGAFPPDPGAWRARYEAAAAIEPALSSTFEVRLDGRTLHYTREECAEADTAARFFLHLTPLDANDLPADRRAAGFGNLDFAFGDRGLRYEGRCLASVPLPDYGVARAVTGQFEGGARLWEGEFAFPAASGQRAAPRR